MFALPFPSRILLGLVLPVGPPPEIGIAPDILDSRKPNQLVVLGEKDIDLSCEERECEDTKGGLE